MDSELKTKKKIFFVLFTSIFSCMLGVGIIVPILPIYAETLGATGFWLGAIFAGFSLTRSISMPLVGRFSDRMGRKRFISFGLLVYTLSSLGYIYAEQGVNLDEAIELIGKALSIEPENGAYIDSLGWAYFKKGQIQEALKELERAVGLLEDPVIYDHLGDAYFESGKIKKALEQWRKSLELDPEQEQVSIKLKKHEKDEKKRNGN